MPKRTEIQECALLEMLMLHLSSNPTVACIQGSPPFHFPFVSLTVIHADWAKPIKTPHTQKNDNRMWIWTAFGTKGGEQTRATQLTLGKLISFFLDVLFFFLYKWLWVFRDPDVDFHFIDSEQSHRFFSEPAILFIILCLLCTAEPKLQIVCDQHLNINELMNKALKMAENES